MSQQLARCASPAASAYRHLLRAAAATFGADAAAVARCRAEARARFVANAGERDAARARALVADALDAAAFLRRSVVQASLNGATGRYEMRVRPEPEDSAASGTEGADGTPLRVTHASAAAADGERARAAATGEGEGAGGGCGRPGGCSCAGAPPS